MNENIITAHGIRKVYRTGAREVRAVDGIDLKLARGRSVAVIGPSGAGKSTLLHILGGLDRPTSGNVMLEGIDIYRMPDKERSAARNSRIGFVFQFYHLLPEFTALENVMLPCLIKGQGARGKGQGAREMAEEALKKVGLGKRASHYPSELSGGESQRVAIARALINSPQALLCDEPAGNLDSKNSEMIYELLFHIKAHSNTAVVIVTHDEKVSSRTDETIRIKDGKVV